VIHLDIRTAGEKDVEKMVEIYNHYVRKTTVTFNTEEADTCQFLETFYADEEYYTLKALCEEDRIIGFCSLNPFNKKEAYRRSAYVSVYLLPEFTGRGFGKKALLYLEETASSKNVHSLIALICTENERSCGFFEKHGYRRVGELKQAGEKFGRLLDVVYYQKII